MKLALYSSVGITAGKAHDFVLRDEVEVTVDGVLESGSGNSKFQSRSLVVLVLEHTVDQAARERVTTTDAVDDWVNLVTLRLIELLAIVDKGLPAIVGSAE